MPSSRSTRILPFFLFFLSGFSSLVYEVVWSRMLVLVFGNTTLATGIILSSFMVGLSLGSYIWGRLARTWKWSYLSLFGFLEVFTGLYVLAFPLLLGAAEPLEIWLTADEPLGHYPLAVIRGLFCFSLLLVPTFLMGGTLPVMGKHLIPGERGLGRDTALLYGLNTVGAVLGAAATGFLLMRVLGSSGSYTLAAVVNLLAGTIALLTGRGAPTAGERFEDLPAPPRSSAPVHSRSTVYLVILGLGISGFCGLAYEVLWTRLLILVVDAPEIADHFARENGRILRHDKASLYINDARHFLLTTRQKYGVIVADATHPRGYDSWVLFTREFYELVKERLEPEGVFSQWVPLHGLNLEQYMAIVRTFWTAFPNTSIWTVDKAHTILLGSLSQGRMDFRGMVRRISPDRVKEHLRPVGLADPFELLSYFSMGERGIRRMVEAFPDLISDDFPRHLFFPVCATFGEQYGQWPEENCRHLEKYEEAVVPYLANLGSTENQVRNTLNRIQMYRRRP